MLWLSKRRATLLDLLEAVEYSSGCVSKHWKELTHHLGIDPHQHLDLLEQSSEADKRCNQVSAEQISVVLCTVVCIATVVTIATNPR